MAGKTIYDEENKIWVSANPTMIFNPKNNLAHAILWSLSNIPDKIVQINHETNIQLTAGFIKQQTLRAAANLQKLGYKQGDIFGIIAKNSHYLSAILYASFCLACPVNTLDPTFTKHEILHMLSITKPKVMFCDANIYDLVRECLDELEIEASIFTFSGCSGDSIPVENLFEETSDADEFIVADIDGENTTAAIVCTSGSTGLSKGVCLSHAILLLQATGIPTGGEDVLLGFSTVYWISGLLSYIAGGIKGVCRVMTTDRFTPDLLLEIIEEHRVSYFVSASFFLLLTLRSDRFLETDLSSIRCIVCGGSKLSNETALEILKYLPNGRVAQIYGMTEVGGCTSLGLIQTKEDTSVGQLLFGIQVKIIDDSGNRLGENESGEICTKTLFKFLGYYNNEEATECAIDDEGFLKTGDIGYFDCNGNLYLIDRKKEMIKYCNSQVSPSEIEQFLIKSPNIKAACVVGIPHPIAGDLPAAVIIPNECEILLTKEEVQQMVTDEFADYKRLRGGVYFVNSMPLTASGKIVRRLVKEQAIEMYKAENIIPDS